MSSPAGVPSADGSRPGLGTHTLSLGCQPPDPSCDDSHRQELGGPFSSFYLSAPGPLHDMPVHLPQALGTQPGSLVSVLEVGDPLITPGLGVMIRQLQAGEEGRAVARASGFHQRQQGEMILACCLFSLSPLAPPMPHILIRVLRRTRGPGFHSAAQKSAA